MSLCCAAPALVAPPAAPSLYQRWHRGPSSHPTFFPLAVWLQNPKRAAEYKRAGFNTFVGLYRGPNADQLEALRAAGMKVICHQNNFAREHLEDDVIIGWMHGDEPDNAQSLGQGKGYGPPIAPEKIVRDYQRLRESDPSRPVFLNLGQGVAWDNWIGRGVRRNHPEDYPLYVQGCDIASFDIYPAVHDSPEVSGKLWFVGRGVERLVGWAGLERVVWNCLECTRISNEERKPTPEEVRAEAWMSLIHGSRGLVYFVHQFKPVFREAALLDDSEMLAAVTGLNRQITDLARVLNTITVTNIVAARSNNPDVPVAFMTKRHANALYIFAVAMRSGETEVTFESDQFVDGQSAEVLDEKRVVSAKARTITDTFGAWQVHLYRIPKRPGATPD